LRGGGLRIAYSRRPEARGYYLQEPPIEPLKSQPELPADRDFIRAIRRMSVPEKNRQAFSAAAFALRQKQLLLAEENPEWGADEVEAAARRMVYGAGGPE
jgi:hypothetical protein